MKSYSGLNITCLANIVFMVSKALQYVNKMRHSVHENSLSKYLGSGKITSSKKKNPRGNGDLFCRDDCPAPWRENQRPHPANGGATRNIMRWHQTLSESGQFFQVPKTERSPRKRRSFLSGRLDSNQRPHAPQTCALPGCATSRKWLGTCVPHQRGYVPKNEPEPVSRHRRGCVPNFQDCKCTG